MENNLTELWAILDWATPGLLGSRTAFRKVWAAPIESGVDPVRRPPVRPARRAVPAAAPQVRPRHRARAAGQDRDRPGDRADPRAGGALRVAGARVDGAHRARRRGHPPRSRARAAHRAEADLQPPRPLPAPAQRPAARAARRSSTSATSCSARSWPRTARCSSSRSTSRWRACSNATSPPPRSRPCSSTAARPCGPASRWSADFQDGAAPVFLLSLKAGGTGLNLTRADHVIHFDRWWNPAVEDQATDRAYRIGQTRPVQVHRLVTEGTIEQKVGQLLERKRTLAESVLGSGEVALTELSNDELRDLVQPPDAAREHRWRLSATTSPSSAPGSPVPPPPASSPPEVTPCCSSSSTPSATTAAAPTGRRASTAGPTPTRPTSPSPAAPTTSGCGSRTSRGVRLRTQTGGLDAGAGREQADVRRHAGPGRRGHPAPARPRSPSAGRASRSYGAGLLPPRRRPPRRRPHRGHPARPRRAWRCRAPRAHAADPHRAGRRRAARAPRVRPRPGRLRGGRRRRLVARAPRRSRRHAASSRPCRSGRSRCSTTGTATPTRAGRPWCTTPAGRCVELYALASGSDAGPGPAYKIGQYDSDRATTASSRDGVDRRPAAAAIRSFVERQPARAGPRAALREELPVHDDLRRGLRARPRRAREAATS